MSKGLLGDGTQVKTEARRWPKGCWIASCLNRRTIDNNFQGALVLMKVDHEIKGRALVGSMRKWMAMIRVLIGKRAWKYRTTSETK